MSGTRRYTFATLPRTQRGQPIVLGGDPKGKNFLYANGNSVIIRNIENPAICDIYTEHSCAVNVAKYSPSGFYIASGDQSGKVRIWDTVNPEHLLKNEYQPISGTIRDIAWSPDSQRIVVVGEGRERFGHVFIADTGTSVGEISGHSKSINSCDFKPTRPFRIITGSEDNNVGIFEGPPFKFKMTKAEHTKFVQTVRYSSDGNLFASGGFDGNVYLYDGKTSERVSEVGNPAHSGGVYALAWSPDNKQIITASGDKTCRLWDVETRTTVSEFVMGTTLDDQQLSCLWQGSHILSVSLSGFINYLDVNNPSKPLRIIKGHNKPITAMTVSADKNSLYTASHDGFVTHWDVASGDSERVQGKGHGNQVNSMQCSASSIYTCGIDDSVKEVNRDNLSYTMTDIKLDSQPRSSHLSDDSLLVASVKEISCITNNMKVWCLPVPYEPSSIAFSSMLSDVAVGGSYDNKVHIYSLAGISMSPKKELEHMGPITDISYSPDQQYLVAADGNRKLILYRLPGYERAFNTEWGFHTGRVNCVAWSPDSLHVASGSLDTNIIIWSIDKPNTHIIVKNAHPQNQITGLAWLNNTSLASTGQDCNTKLWDIDF